MHKIFLAQIDDKMSNNVVYPCFVRFMRAFFNTAYRLSLSGGIIDGFFAEKPLCNLTVKNYFYKVKKAET